MIKWAAKIGLGVAIAGCGGADAGLFPPIGSSSLDGGIVIDATSGNVGTTSGGLTGSSGGGAVPVGDASGGSSSGGDASSSGGLVDASPGGGGDSGGVGKDAGTGSSGGSGSGGGGGYVNPGIPCGALSTGAAQYCDPSSQFCCLEGSGTDVCMPNSAACPGLLVMCVKQLDCPDQDYCCGTRTAQGSYSAFQCLVSCNEEQNGDELCDPNQQPNECAAGGKTCKARGTSGYFDCQ